MLLRASIVEQRNEQLHGSQAWLARWRSPARPASSLAASTSFSPLYLYWFKQCSEDHESCRGSFRREVKSYERYEIRSRVLRWDAKWLVIGSWFVRNAKDAKEREMEGEVVVLASALSKYVVKKGRFTVSSERRLRSEEHSAKSRNRDTIRSINREVWIVVFM